MKVIVVGAGISGLAAANRILSRVPSAEVAVLEAGARAGGWLGTSERDGFVIERGADSILGEKPAARALVDELGLSDRVVRTRSDRHGAYVLRSGRMVRIPEGYSLLAPGGALAFLRSGVLSASGAARAMLEPLLPMRREPDEESLASFVRRRLGWENLERLAQPLVSGIYGGGAEVLSLEATMPRFPLMERTHGSVARGIAASTRRSKEQSGSGARYGLFFAFDRGMQVLIDALTRRIGSRLELEHRVQSIAPSGRGWQLTLVGGTTRAADAVVIALASPSAAELLPARHAELAGELRRIGHASAATVTFAWDRAEVAHPLDAYGLVVPAVEQRRILAATFASEKWPGRAPEGRVLIRVFVGGPNEEDMERRSDDDLRVTAEREIAACLGIDAPPLFSIVSRFSRAMPRYTLGHAELTKSIVQNLSAIPRLALAGNSLSGVGIPDAIASGEKAALKVLGELG